jgi:hypothetical protein
VDIKLEYYENGGDAVAKLLWSSPSTPKQIIPKTQLFPGDLSTVPKQVAKQTAPKPAPNAPPDKPKPEKPKPAEPKKPAPPPDAATNGGFETGDLSGWTTYGGEKIELTTQNPQSGGHALQMVGGNGMYVSQRINDRCKANQPYTVSVWVKIVPIDGRMGIVRLRVARIGDLSKVDFGEAKADTSQPNVWQKLEVTATFAPEDLKGAIFVGIRHFGFPGTEHIDSLSVAPQ